MDYPLIHKPKHPAIALPQIQPIVIGEGKFIRQSGSEQYGHVILQLEPNPEQNGCFMLWSVAESAIPLISPPDCPEHYLDYIYQGLCEAICEKIEGSRYYRQYVPFPYENTNVRIVGGSYHEADSKRISFYIAAYLALADAISKL